MLRSGAVDELAADVGDELASVVHSHPAAVGHIGHIGDLDILAAAVFFESFPVAGLHDHRHALLRLADSELGRIQAAVFRRHAVEIYVKSRGELAYGNADASGAEIVGLLDELRDLGTAEQALELALLGGVTLLHLASAGFYGALGMFLGRPGGAAYAVAARPAAEQQYHIAGSWAFAAHVLRLHGPDHGSGLKPLGHIAGW